MSSQPHSAEAGDFVSLSDEKSTRDIIASSVLGLWEVVNNLTRLRPARSERYRVTIFGSSRLGPQHWSYAAVRDLAAELTRLDCDIVTGGGPGLMQAANEGAACGDPEQETNSIGIRVHLPFEQEVNPFVEQVFVHRTFFSRLHHFVLVSDAFVVVPGGIGTLLELAMVWQLLQVRKLFDTPLILLGPMWAELVDWAGRHMLSDDMKMISPEDLKLPHCVATPAEALAILRQHRDVWERARTGAASPPSASS